MAQELNGMMAHYQKQHQNLKILITGGDLSYFEHIVKNSIFARPHLIGFGLNHILRLQHAEV
jgi:type III pantothenate kinase